MVDGKLAVGPWITLLRVDIMDKGPMMSAVGPLIDKSSRQHANVRVPSLRRLDDMRRCFRMVGPEEVVRCA